MKCGRQLLLTVYITLALSLNWKYSMMVVRKNYKRISRSLL